MVFPEFRPGAYVQVEYKNDYMSYTCEMRVHRVITSPEGAQVVYAKTEDDSAAITFSTSNLKEARDVVGG